MDWAEPLKMTVERVVQLTVANVQMAKVCRVKLCKKRIGGQLVALIVADGKVIFSRAYNAEFCVINDAAIQCDFAYALQHIHRCRAVGNAVPASELAKTQEHVDYWQAADRRRLEQFRSRGQ